MICRCLQVAIEQLQSELEAAQRGEDEAREAAQKVWLFYITHMQAARGCRLCRQRRRNQNKRHVHVCIVSINAFQIDT